MPAALDAGQSMETLVREAEIATRFADLYRRQFAELIDRLNRHADQATDRNGLRLCVEAIDMMLATQSFITRTLAQLESTAPAQRRAA
jgi:hypothetical protein